MKMPGMTGMELLEKCQKIKPELPFIIMTACGTIETAVEAMKKHAYDFITKPFQNEQLKGKISFIVPLDITLPEALEQVEGKLIKRALDHTGQVQAQAAEILGISRHVMHYKMKKFGMLK